MPNVGLSTAREVVPPDTGISIRYTVEVGGLAVYSELYDVRKLKRELDRSKRCGNGHAVWRRLSSLRISLVSVHI